MRLSDYLDQSRLLLRDTNGLFTTTASLKKYINSARYFICKVTGCLRILVSGQSAFGASGQAGSIIPGAFIPGTLPGALPNAYNQSGANNTVSNSFNTIRGVELYPYSYANPYIKAANAGVKGIIDVISVSVSWGGIRPSLDWLPWEDLQAYARSYNFGVTSYPFVWSTYGSGEKGQVWLFPVPVGASEMEWDTTCAPLPLYSDNDYDAVPEPFQQEVCFYAAYLAFLGAQRHSDAQAMLNIFNENLGIDQTSSDKGKTASFYYRAGLP